ncbi:MAG: hypothetical protein ABIN97_05210 [Ginsengibacter sp.]
MNYKLLRAICPMLLFCFCFAQCKKQKQTPKTELEKLPPITQTGANTFGCLLNGVAYTPGGGGILDQVLKTQYDPTFQGGQFYITTKRFFENNQSIYLSIDGFKINDIGHFTLYLQSMYRLFYNDSRINCQFDTYSDTPTSGFLDITKFDKANRIISGTFNFKFSNQNCGTIDATDGRFDVKY